ncbi:hypothetical protein LOTGIDRAFT_167450 [Lottia gigantea]|uniref:Globin n=1 Tax=Lottia gigantea TaxID=225164 RepID=V3ZYY7_LOTGI|nr:hypothetical protein LOTGIDRAFT_167450 [Lottia gigantea]ESO86216.1 hypothetical protein LOTGIDRAFT_167450 [Lottia gigantea]
MDDNQESLKENYRFRCHVGLFCETIRIAVEEMREIEEVLLFLKDLGRKHRMYGATPTYIKTAGEGIVYAIDRKLGNEFTRSMKTSWKKFFTILQDSILEGLEFG